MWPIDRASQLVQKSPRLDESLILFIGAQQPQGHVIHGGPEDQAVTLDVETPAAILRMLSGEEVASNLS